MRGRQFAFAACLFAATSSGALAQPAQPEIYRSLERMADAGARIATTFCGDENTVFGGALAGINALAERGGAPPIVPDSPGIRGFADAYDEILTSGVDVDSLEQAAIEGMINAYDPSGSWMSPEEAHRPRDAGILIELNGAGGTPLVVRVFEGGPAAQAGILPGDRLTEINGEPTQNLRLSEVVSRLQGGVGVPITVAVEREGAPLTFSMRRALNTRETIYWRIQDNIGIITIETFHENSARDIRDAIRAVGRETDEPSGYIIDLRNNGGGRLDQIIEALDYFIDGGAVVHVRPYAECNAAEAQTYNVRRGRDETDGAPIMLLVNENTASGAEMFAAALRERRSARLVGQTTFGNARVHTVIPVNSGRDGFLKLSTGMMVSPAGLTWDTTGLTPDIGTGPRDPTSDLPLETAIGLLHASH